MAAVEKCAGGPASSRDGWTKIQSRLLGPETEAPVNVNVDCVHARKIVLFPWDGYHRLTVRLPLGERILLVKLINMDGTQTPYPERVCTVFPPEAVHRPGDTFPRNKFSQQCMCACKLRAHISHSAAIPYGSFLVSQIWMLVMASGSSRALSS